MDLGQIRERKTPKVNEPPAQADFSLVGQLEPAGFSFGPAANNTTLDDEARPFFASPSLLPPPPLPPSPLPPSLLFFSPPPLPRAMAMVSLWWSLLAAVLLQPLMALVALANIEKAVFLGPPAVAIPPPPPLPPSSSSPSSHSSQQQQRHQLLLKDLRHLDVLIPGGPSLRTSLASEFSKNESDREVPSWDIVGDVGRVHWIVLDNLREGQRYELRICWAATVLPPPPPRPWCPPFPSPFTVVLS